MALYKRDGVPDGWTSGSGLDCTVNASALRGVVNHRLNGIAMHSLATLDDYPYHMTNLVYNLPQSVQQDILNLRVPSSRVYNMVNDEAKFGTPERVIDGYDTCLSLWGWDRNSFVVCTGSNDGVRYYSADQAVERLANLIDRGYHLFELENEPYSAQWGGSSRFSYDLAGESAYLDYFKAIYEGIKSREPGASVLINFSRADGQYFALDMLSRAEGYYDGISLHHYLSGSVIDGVTYSAYSNMTFEEWVIGENLRGAYYLDLLHSEFGEYPIYVTEWGMQAIGAPDSSPKDGNIWALLTNAYLLLLFHDTQFVVHASAWQLLNEWWPGRTDTGKFLYLRPDQPERRGYLYWLWYYLLRYMGRYYLDAGGIAPVVSVQDSTRTYRTGLVTPVLATMSWDYRKIYLIVLNASWQNSYPSVIRFAGFQITGANALVIRDDDEGAPGIVEGVPSQSLISSLSLSLYGDRIQFVLPSHSIVLVEVSGTPVASG